MTPPVTAPLYVETQQATGDKATRLTEAKLQSLNIVYQHRLPASFACGKAVIWCHDLQGMKSV
jgi:hypothetical protein